MRIGHGRGPSDLSSRGRWASHGRSTGLLCHFRRRRRANGTRLARSSNHAAHHGHPIFREHRAFDEPSLPVVIHLGRHLRRPTIGTSGTHRRNGLRRAVRLAIRTHHHHHATRPTRRWRTCSGSSRRAHLRHTVLRRGRHLWRSWLSIRSDHHALLWWYLLLWRRTGKGGTADSMGRPSRWGMIARRSGSHRGRGGARLRRSCPL